MFDIGSFVRENIKTLVPYSSARDEFQGKEGIFLDANENPYGKFNRYPDPYQRELKLSISKIKQIPPENIFLGNGSDEIIDLCFRTFCRPGLDKALTFTPTYGMYEVSANINDVSMIRIPLNKNFQIDLEKLLPNLDDPLLKLIIICSPNNPTGNAMDHTDVEFIVSRLKSIVLIDEAYNDFSGKVSFKSMIGKYPNLIVMQTFSKSLGLAGARIGMAFTSQEIVHFFNKMKPPYNISSLNQKVALKKLSRISQAVEQVNKITSERERVRNALSKLNFVKEIYPSDSNFLLVKLKDPDYIYNALAADKIIVRNRSKIVPGCIRITIGARSENTKLLNALKKFE